LDSVGTRFHECRYRPFHGLDAREERPFAEKAVVDGDVEAAAIGSEKTLETGKHRTALK